MDHISNHLSAAALTQTDTERQRSLRPEALKWVDAHKWRFDAYHPELEPVLPAVKMFCAEVFSGVTPARWLTLLGPSGIGKTLILRQAFNFLERYKAQWKYRVKSGFRAPECAHIVPLEDLKDYKAPLYYSKFDLIYIEDIGAGHDLADTKGPGAIMRGRIAELLQLRGEKWTLGDSNFNRSEIAQKLDPRIASRLKRDGSRMIEISKNVPDFNDRK